METKVRSSYTSIKLREKDLMESFIHWRISNPSNKKEFYILSFYLIMINKITIGKVRFSSSVKIEVQIIFYTV